ncbi:unnamed protein product [Bursaphelenchus xylophilus]|uniref:(pine wood nematode) hypothetical protein n=1 Tax=Bursaphelenchus xylophilus TaxID=6326 RepID=A0A1I7SC58_BURXY|nr:unnamed protein product [Bursaphelenchus xylophilus]CAG9094692.1 unnamed protein product [Bursaphelenchus xylophilus]
MEQARSKLTIKNDLLRCFVAEFLGTAILVLTINSVVAQSVLHSAPNKLINVNLGVGLGIAFGIAVCARISGGHINPAVSLMFFTFRQLSAIKFAIYVAAQFLGAFVGALLTYIVYCDAISRFDGGIRQVYGTKATAHIFASYSSPHLGVVNGLLDQIIATAVFCLLIAHTVDKRNQYPTWVQPFIIGTAFVLIGTAFALNAGYPCNPARDFGPRFFTLLAGYGWDVFSFKNYKWFWIPILGPLIGGVLGGWIYEVSVGFQTPEAEEYQIVASGRELHVVKTKVDEAEKLNV